MRTIGPGVSAPIHASFRLRTVSLLIPILTCALSSQSFAISFSLGDQLVSIGQNFTGGSRSTSQFFIPPDTMGAVGPTGFVELLNGRYAVYDKGSGAVVQTSSLDQFWRNAGTVPTTFSFDPRVVYDPFSNRYLAASVNNPSQPNDFLLAVSRTSDPTQGWTGLAIKSDVTQQRWADFPTLGFNREGVYLSANMFPVRGSQTTTTTTTIVAVPKTDLLAPIPTVAHATIFANNSLSATGFSVQPAIDLDNKTSSAILLSSPIGFADQVKRSDIIGNIRSPILNTAGNIILFHLFLRRSVQRSRDWRQTWK